MGLETASHIDELVASNPVGASDALSTADDHLRMIKTVLKNDFPDVDEAVGTIHVSATAPALPLTGCTLWHDTPTDTLKLRDKAGTGWTTLAVSPLTSNSVDINAGTVDGVAIGGSTIENSPIGAVTPASIKGTTIESTGAATFGGDISVTGNIAATGTVDGRDVATDGAKLDTVDTGANVVPTGLVLPYVGITAPSGWILAGGGTIGNASSGGTQRANADTEDLFALYWNSMADAQAPVSGGRGASAAADFAANKTITISNLSQSAPFGTAGAITPHGSTGGSVTHTLTESEIPAHTHTQRGSANSSVDLLGSSVIHPANQGNVVSDSNSASVTASAGGGGAHNNMPPWVALAYIIKL